MAEHDRQNRNQAMQNRDMYKETLLGQMKINEMAKKNFGKMSMVEKRMNRTDLRAFKNKEKTTVNSMVPGINNVDGVGSKPLMRGAMRLMDDPTPYGRKGGEIYFSPNRNSLPNVHFTPPKRQDPMRMSEPRETYFARSRAVNYNPITNPVDVAVKNP